jgi:hypothetical protein
VRGGYFGRYVPRGHLVYMNQGTLFAVRFDLDRLETLGQPVPALDGVAGSITTGGVQWRCPRWDFVYVSGGVTTTNNPIDWLTRDGKTAALRTVKADWGNPRFSPDGQSLAMDISDGTQRDIFVYAWARDTLTQLTFDAGRDRMPVWTPDGRRVRVRVRSGEGGRVQPVLGECGRHGRGHEADRQPGVALAPFRGIRAGKFLTFTAVRPGHGDGPDDPADGGRHLAGVDARQADRLS